MPAHLYALGGHRQPREPPRSRKARLPRCRPASRADVRRPRHVPCRGLHARVGLGHDCAARGGSPRGKRFAVSDGIEIWDLWLPGPGATGLPFARSRISGKDAGDRLLVHAAPAKVQVTVRDAAGKVDEMGFQSRGAAQKVRHLVELVEDVARLAASVRPLEWLVIPVEYVLVAGLVEDDLELLARPFEDLPKFNRGRVGHVDLVAHPPEKRLVDQRTWLEAGTEHDHGLEGGADRHPGAGQGYIVDASLQADA